MYFASPSSLQHAPLHHSTQGGQNGIVGGHPSVAIGGASIHPGLKPSQKESIDKLVMQISNPKLQITKELIYERRLFFERLVMLNEQHGEVLSGPPQVSKSPVDLFSLFYAVKQRGGFEKVILLIFYIFKIIFGLKFQGHPIFVYRYFWNFCF